MLSVEAKTEIQKTITNVVRGFLFKKATDSLARAVETALTEQLKTVIPTREFRVECKIHDIRYLSGNVWVRLCDDETPSFYSVDFEVSAYQGSES